MKPTVTLGVLALFGLVSWAYFYYTPEAQEAFDLKTPSIVDKKVLMLASDDEVVWFQIHNADRKDPITLQKKEGAWFVKWPVLSQANSKIAEGLVTALLFSNKARQLDVEGALDEYGLTAPKIKVGIRTLKDSQPRFLLFGDEAQTGEFVFAKWEDEEKYFLMSANVKEAFNISLYSLRQKQIFQSPLEEVSKLHLRQNSRDYEIAMQGDRWVWMEPIDMLGETLEKSQVDALVTQLKSLYIKEFIDHTKTSPKSVGISANKNYVEIEEKRGGIQKLLIGNPVPTKDSFHAKFEDDLAVFYISKSNLDKFFEMVKSFSAKKGPLGSLG